MAEVQTLFVTKLYRARVEGLSKDELLCACKAIAAGDAAGQRWSKDKGYRGYTSYASLNDLPKRDPTIAALKQALDKHAAVFANALHLEFAGRKPKLDSLWINVLDPGVRTRGTSIRIRC